MAQHFGYYDDWKTAILECPQCGWTGTFDEGVTECYRALTDSSCPACDGSSAPILAVVFYPTIEESESNWKKLSRRVKDEIIAHKRLLSRWKSASLKTDGDLPDLEGSSLVLSWDLVTEGSDRFVVIKHGDVGVWREPALYESAERFDEITKLLTKKYGTRLADLAPTAASEYFLYGDDFNAPDAVGTIRASIRESHRSSLA